MSVPSAGSVEAGTRSTVPPTSPTPAAARSRAFDAADSRAWLDALGSTGPPREEAIARLHALLLRAARFEVARRRAGMPGWSSEALDDVALQSADDALLAVLRKLDRFGGRSRFTTWAYKFALLETAVKLRRRPWEGRELSLEAEGWPQFADARASPAADAMQRELLDAVRRAIRTALTPHQREVLVAVALNGVPIDVLAERLGSTRGALYKTIHDARQKLRRQLAAEGHDLDELDSGGHADAHA
jgi:RNA polymerase sigma-70 factor (ECF subfamily)